MVLADRRTGDCMLAGWLAVEAVVFVSENEGWCTEADVGKKGECWLAIAIEPDNEADVGKKGECWLAITIEPDNEADVGWL